MLIYFNISSADGKLKHADLSAIESGVFDAGLISSTMKNDADLLKIGVVFFFATHIATHMCWGA